MKEEDYKKLRCCGPAPKNTGIPAVEYDTVLQKEVICLPVIYLCSGPQCAGWSWSQKDYDKHQIPIEDREGYCGLRRT